MSGVAHTTGPLALAKHGAIVGGPVHQFRNGEGQRQIAMCMGAGTITGDHEEVIANAARIVHCWNMHDELVEALELLVCLNSDDDEATLNAIAKANAVIARATGSATC